MQERSGYMGAAIYLHLIRPQINFKQMKSEDRNQWIEKYLASELDGEELIYFKQQMKEDSAFREEVELQGQLSDSFDGGSKLQDFRDLLKKTDASWASDKPVARQASPLKIIRYVGAIAAAVLLGIVAYQFLSPFTAAPTATELFATNHSPYTMVLSERSSTQDENAELLNEAMLHYINEQFEEARDDFQTLSGIEPDNISYQFYTAQAALSIQRAAEAIPILQRLLELEEHPFQEQSRWYLALAYLQEGELEKSQAELKTLQEGQFKYEAAQALLRRLDALGF